MVSPADIDGLADHLAADGHAQAASELRNASVGVISATELCMAWRFHIVQALSLDGLSPACRAEAERLRHELDRALA